MEVDQKKEEHFPSPALDFPRGDETRKFVRSNYLGQLRRPHWLRLKLKILKILKPCTNSTNQLFVVESEICNAFVVESAR